jgi:hypothetical protein
MKRLSHTGRQIRELVEMIEASAERTEVFAEVCENLEKAIGFSGAVLSIGPATTETLASATNWS